MTFYSKRQKYFYFWSFAAPDLRCEAAYTLANPCASCRRLYSQRQKNFVVDYKKGRSMAIELKRLIERVSNMDITLVAGEDGLKNLVSWVHMVETTEAYYFLDGGEIAFTTGLGVNGSDGLLRLVEMIEQHDAAGVIVNIGPFIDEIPESVLSFCNEHTFPLFVVPWKVHLAEIMRIFCQCLTRDEQRHIETAAAFQNAIFFPKQEELYVIPLSQRDFKSDWRYAVCLVRVRTLKNNQENRIDALSNALWTHMNHSYRNFAIFDREGDILAVTAEYDEEMLREFIAGIRRFTEKKLRKEEHVCFGVGKLTKSIRCLYKSYHQAVSIVQLQEDQKLSPSLYFYSDLGIYKLLLGIEDREIMEEYYEKTLEPLALYDEKNDADLTAVLDCYLRNNGSVKETADELFVHRNTINYKLNKIEDLLGTDLSLLNTRLQLAVGLMLRRIL